MDFSRLMTEMLCERGNVLLVQEDSDNLQAYLRTGVGTWLEISYRSQNYPAMYVQAIEISDAELTKHIIKEFANNAWIALKMCLEGVPVEDSYVVDNTTLQQHVEDS